MRALQGPEPSIPMDPATTLRRKMAIMWMMWDAKDYERTEDVASYAVVPLGASLYSSRLETSEENDIPRQSDVLVGFVNKTSLAATVELRTTRHENMIQGCILRVRVPAHGRALAYHLGALVVVGMRVGHLLALTCDVQGVYAVHAMVGDSERQALAHQPDRLMLYHPQ